MFDGAAKSSTVAKGVPDGEVDAGTLIRVMIQLFAYRHTIDENSLLTSRLGTAVVANGEVMPLVNPDVDDNPAVAGPKAAIGLRLPETKVQVGPPVVRGPKDHVVAFETETVDPGHHREWATVDPNSPSVYTGIDAGAAGGSIVVT